MHHHHHHTMGGSVDGQGLLQLDKDTFWPYLEQQQDTLVVVDFYTDWCGPCKLIYPELVKLSQERTDVRFVKVNCNKSNKELGMQLAIKVAPTFHLYRNKTKVADMTGAKMDKLIALINQHQPPKN
uniref:thioredoxin f2 n=1 Tax=Chlamydomonas reinhardtii TaxID=3055 RepID=UPI000F62C187|nr:Chain A, thioredoxin f2 [Chlamydomonas reinhardtii]6I1C_B Chain B, thioredoxin f2 [Chlamydomonas reinhardtii]6I1C_C Chain C, thioredoxin f2 [Chlamydomonas reinhardtii]